MSPKVTIFGKPWALEKAKSLWKVAGLNPVSCGEGLEFQLTEGLMRQAKTYCPDGIPINIGILEKLGVTNYKCE